MTVVDVGEVAQPRGSTTARSAGASALLWPAALALIFVLALAPRLSELSAFVTPDEPLWTGRALNFSNALRRGDVGATYQSGHPGVTTMWLASAGLEAAGLLQPGSDGQVPKSAIDGERFLPSIAAARVPFALLGTLLAPLVALLGARLFGRTTGLLAGALVALDPFLLAHSRVTHVDTPVTVFMTLALLAGLARWARGGGVGYLLLAGFATGLALLSKAPSVLLVVFLPGVALGAPALARRPLSWLDAGRRLLEVAGAGLLAAATFVALWPAMWQDPITVLASMRGYVESTAGSPHEHLNFFLGGPVLDPGPLFYPLALAFRVPPLTMLGVMAALVALCWTPGPAGRGPLAPPWRGLALVLVLFVALFMVMVTLSPKKFDRYLLPVFPALDLLAAVGMASLARAWLGGSRASRAALLAGAVGLAAQSALALPLHPYYLSFYNPLVGGGALAPSVLLIGWGEGMDQVLATLEAQPHPERLTLYAPYDRMLEPLFSGEVLPYDRYDPAQADYVMLYISQLQRNLLATLADTYLNKQEPVQLVRIGGIEYAWLYRVPRASIQTRVGAEYGGLLRLEGYALSATTVAPGERLDVTLHWRLLAPTAIDYQAFVHMVDGRGVLRAQKDRRAGGERKGTSVWQVGDTVADLHRLALPRDLPPGQYRLAVGLYDLATSARLAITAPGSATDVGSDVLWIGPITVTS